MGMRMIREDQINWRRREKEERRVEAKRRRCIQGST